MNETKKNGTCLGHYYIFDSGKYGHSFSVRGAETSASMSAVDYLAFCNKIMSDFSLL